MNEIQKIEKYLLGQLQGAELSDFARRLKNDEQLQKEVQKMSEVIELTKAQGRISIKEKLRVHDKELDTLQSWQRRRRNIRYLLAVVAVIAAMIVVFVLLTREGAKDGPKELFAEHFELYRAPITLRGTGDEELLERKEAYESYGQGDVARAMSAFQQMATLNQIDHFYYGMSLLADEQTVLARRHFAPVLTGGSDYVQQARWYLALAYLYENDLARAKPVLKRIITDGAFQYERAQRILDQIEVN